MIIEIVRPILFGFVTSRAVKQLLVDLLRALAKKTENTLDDDAVDVIERNLIS